ncbi:MAG: FAD-dependent oxidoreductase [Clostridiales bacterium]|nr:FAD-dependent oxidoreductase [Clostridiales bacterium]
MSKVCIIGAGLSGLVCGMRLAKAGFDVVILEEMTYPGGLMASTHLGGEYIELLPHHVRRTDKALNALTKELGCDNKLKWYDAFWYGRASRKKVGYFEGGFASLTNLLIQVITDHGGKIFYSVSVSEITTNGEGRYLTSCVFSESRKYEVESDYIIFTGSCRTFVNVSHGLPMSMNMRDQLMNITYHSRICLMMQMRKLPSDAYIQLKFPGQPDTPFARIVNHSACFNDRNYGGQVTYLVGKCQISDPLWVESDQMIMEEYLRAYRKLYPLIKKSDIKSWRLTKVRYAVSEHAPESDLTEPIDGVYVCSSALTRYSTTEVPENRMDTVIALANDICTRITEKEKALHERKEDVIITAI